MGCTRRRRSKVAAIELICWFGCCLVVELVVDVCVCCCGCCWPVVVEVDLLPLFWLPPLPPPPLPVPDDTEECDEVEESGECDLRDPFRLPSGGAVLTPLEVALLWSLSAPSFEIREATGEHCEAVTWWRR